MSLSSTIVIKAQLAQALGPKIDVYYNILRQYFSAQISRTELDEQIKECLGKDNIPLRQYMCGVYRQAVIAHMIHSAVT